MFLSWLMLGIVASVAFANNDVEQSEEDPIRQLAPRFYMFWSPSSPVILCQYKCNRYCSFKSGTSGACANNGTCVCLATG
ncbi:hypothetical protein CHUAL_007624 [Chamberlinius hualienensis]